MNAQGVIVAILFLLAAAYLCRMIYRSLTVKKGCGTNCKCGVDFSQIQPGDHK
jgi:hypothetical protein